MSEALVPDQLREIIADTLEITPEEVTPQLRAGSIESWDSFRHLQLILALESEYGVRFEPQEIEHLTSVAALQQALTDKGAAL